MNIREMRNNLGRLEELLAEQGEIVLVKNKRPIAKVVPVTHGRKKKMPSMEWLWALQPYQEVPSEVLIREDRDGR